MKCAPQSDTILSRFFFFLFSLPVSLFFSFFFSPMSGPAALPPVPPLHRQRTEGCATRVDHSPSRPVYPNSRPRPAILCKAATLSPSPPTQACMGRICTTQPSRLPPDAEVWRVTGANSSAELWFHALPIFRTQFSPAYIRSHPKLRCGGGCPRGTTSNFRARH